MPVPTWRLVVAAAVASLVVLAAPWPAAVLWVVDGALMAAAVVDWARAVRPSVIPVDRDLPGVVPLGGEAEVRWTVRNPSPRRLLRLTLADELAPSLGATSRRARLVVPPGGRATARTAIRPRRRGKFTPTEIVLRVDGPWRLAARQGRLQVPGVLRVFPPFRSKEEAELRINRARILEIGLRSAPGRGGGTEFDQLREYTVDDEFRRVDWAATARVGRPIVRTYRAERNQTVLLLLDSGRMMAGRVADVPRLDHAMDAVMMLTAVASRLGDKVGLVAFDQVVRAIVPPRAGRDQLGRVTEAMYALEPQLVESDYRGAFASTLGRFRRRALLVLFTELAEQAVTETVLPVLPLLSRHHIVIVASVADPDVAGWAASVPPDASSTYRKAAAVAARTDRARTVALLRGMGATVVDAEPGRLAPLLADAYLKVKATGRL
ncbi:MAG: hypothetical protein QOH36_250 [Actinomycetota bacterium]|nr:hypothetical protein [Actinomycetota bacterium]